MKTINRDLELISECLEGSRTAQKQLYDMYKVKMYTLCLRYMKSRTDAEDMLQEGWIKVFRQLSTYDSSKGTFYGWLRKVFVNTNLEYLRKNKMKIEELDATYQEMISYESNVISHLSMKEMVSLLQSLPAGYRSVFNLYVLEEYTHKEIGELLNISPNTSKTQLMKAKQLMREKVSILQTA